MTKFFHFSEIDIHRRNFTPLSIMLVKVKVEPGGERVDGKVG